MRVVNIIMPERRDGISHVVIGKGQAYLFTNYNDAHAFVEFLKDWLGYRDNEIVITPLALVTDNEWRHKEHKPEE